MRGGAASHSSTAASVAATREREREREQKERGNQTRQHGLAIDPSMQPLKVDNTRNIVDHCFDEIKKSSCKPAHVPGQNQSYVSQTEVISLTQV
jgi:hypothetical protein